jgi:type II secretory pathway pseudopilin PulG
VTRGTRATQSGFSYIEILVGIVILALVAGGIGQGLSQTSGALGKAKTDTAAQKLAAAELDRVHRMPYEEVGITGGSPPGTLQAETTTSVGGIQYRINTDVEYVDDPAMGQPRTYVNYKKVTVVVTPQTRTGKPYTGTTLVAPPAIGAIAGKSTIVATVVDARTDQPVGNAPVTADLSTSPTQTRATGADGKVVFAGLEPSAVSSSDPKYKYRLTVNLPAPWATTPDSAPDQAQQHLAPSQTWTTTLKVFKAATIIVHLRNAQTNQPVTEFAQVQVTTPGPDVLSEVQEGTAGSFTFTQIGERPIQPSASNFTVTAGADCYQLVSVQRPVPANYPTNTTEVFTLNMQPVACGTLDVTVRSTASGNPVIPGAQVQVSGGQASLPATVRDTDANGFARFKIPPSGTVDYVVSAARAGFGAGSILAVVQQNQTTPLTMYLVPSSNTGTIRLTTSTSNKLVRLQALVGTYDASQTTNSLRRADFTGLAAGTYRAYIATGFSGGQPIWNSGKNVTATAGQTSSYSVP